MSRTASWSVHVESDSLDEGDTDILQTPGMPKLYELRAGMYCSASDPSHEYTVFKNHLGVPAQMWRVDFEFTNELDLDNIDPEADPLAPVNPILIPAEINTDSITQVMPANKKDAEGTPIVNFFGEPIASEILNEVEISVITITRWEPWPFPFTKSQRYNNTCNAESFHGLPAGTCLMKCKAVKSFFDGLPYARATYQIKVLIDEENPARENTWVDLELPHEANQYLETAGDMSSARSVTEFGLTGPFIIKDDGTLDGFAGDGSIAESTKTFKMKRKESWTALTLPDR